MPGVRRYGPCEPEDLKQRMRSAVASLGEVEVRSILEEQGMIEVRGGVPGVSNLLPALSDDEQRICWPRHVPPVVTALFS